MTDTRLTQILEEKTGYKKDDPRFEEALNELGEELDLDHNQIVDINPLAQLHQLQELSLEWNQIWLSLRILVT